MHEDQEEGNVKMFIFKKFILSLGGVPYIVVLFLCNFIFII